MSGSLEKKPYEIELFHANALVQITEKVLIRATERQPATLPMFRGNNLRRGCFTGEEFPSTPRLAYSFHDLYTVHSSPVLHQGRVYFGADSKALYCLNADTGEELWRFKTSAEIRSTPLVINTSV